MLFKKKIIHYIANMCAIRAVCGINTIDIANNNDELTLIKENVTCEKCIKIVKH